MRIRKKERADVRACDQTINGVVESDNSRLDQIALKAVKRLPEMLADPRTPVYAIVVYDTRVDAGTASRIARATKDTKRILAPLIRAMNYPGLLLVCGVMPSNYTVTSPVYMYRVSSPRVTAPNDLVLPYHWLEEHFCGSLG